MSTFRALVYKLLVEFEQQLIFKVSRVHPGSLCSEQQSSTAEESFAGGRGRQVRDETETETETDVRVRGAPVQIEGAACHTNCLLMMEERHFPALPS